MRSPRLLAAVAVRLRRRQMVGLQSQSDVARSRMPREHLARPRGRKRSPQRRVLADFAEKVDDVSNMKVGFASTAGLERVREAGSGRAFDPERGARGGTHVGREKSVAAVRSRKETGGGDSR